MAATPDPTCMDDFDPHSLTVDDARRRIAELINPVQGYERLALRAGLGRVLTEAVVSPVNVPPYANSAMDGYALHSADLPTTGTKTLQVVGTALAGTPYIGHITTGQCVRIMTGGKLPEGADTVVMQEHATRSGDQIQINAQHKPAQNTRRAGEDLAIGATAIEAGRRLTPADIGLLASLGIAEAKVRRRVRVAFFSTGDELKSLGEPLADGQIYDSNRYTLHGMLTRLGVDILDMGVIPDQRALIEAAFIQAAALADVLITSGGVSVGDADFVKDTLDRLGTVQFWKIAMKPGRPLAVGKLKHTLFFGLPGNPVSAMVTFYQFVQPALEQLAGQQQQPTLLLQVPCLAPIKKRTGRLEYQRGILSHDPGGTLVVHPTGDQGSGILSSMSRANCFIVLPMDCGNLAAGSTVTVQPFQGLI